jgi:hypothetical protein
MKEENNDKCKTLGNTVVKLVNKVTKLERNLVQSNIRHLEEHLKEQEITAMRAAKMKNKKDARKDDQDMNKIDGMKKSEDKKMSINKKKNDVKKKNGVSFSKPSSTSSSTLPPSNIPEQSSSSRTDLSPPKDTPYLCQPKVLYVGDSVGHTANLRIVEESRKCRIRSVRAYSSVHDKNARWPEKNFSSVVKLNLKKHGKEEFDTLVMTSPTVDITNLDTVKLGPNDSTEALEQKAIASSTSMFKIAQIALEQNKNLKKVVIMEHPPRFDDQMKSKLAMLANTTLSQLWVISPFKDNIAIGRHSLESFGVGSSHLGRYKDYTTGKFDGVHLYGQTGVRDYTNSVKSIMLMALPEQRPAHASVEPGNRKAQNHNTCEQAQYMWRQKKSKRTSRQNNGATQNRYGTQYQNSQSVPTQNRFNMFNQGQGN